jgi:hypothetical protein
MKAKTKPKAQPTVMSIVNGNMPPLSGHQRRLVEFFVEYLRSLPKWQDGSSWDSKEYGVVNKVLFAHFKAANPLWPQRKDGNKYSHYIGDLPDDDHEEYETLMQNDGPPAEENTTASRLLDRRKQLMDVAREKLLVLEFLERYERSRADLGLAPDMTMMLPRKATTAIERQAEATWGERPSHTPNYST